MSVVKVVASVDNNEYKLKKGDGAYSQSIVAPYKTTEVNISAYDDSGNVALDSQTLYVTNEWMPPKTDWEPTDYFNFVDYNRIIGNITYLCSFAERLFLKIERTYLGENKNYESMIYASEINRIEKALENLNRDTYRFPIGETKTYYPNGNTMDYIELNRIESTTLWIYRNLKAQYDALPILEFAFVDQKEIEV